jgi:hypothetical protein
LTKTHHFLSALIIENILKVEKQKFSAYFG